MASLRLFGMESYYNCTFRYRLVVCIKKFTKNALTLATQKEPHPHWFPLGVLFEFLDESSSSLLYGSLKVIVELYYLQVNENGKEVKLTSYSFKM